MSGQEPVHVVTVWLTNRFLGTRKSIQVKSQQVMYICILYPNVQLSRLYTVVHVSSLRLSCDLNHCLWFIDHKCSVYASFATSYETACTCTVVVAFSRHVEVCPHVESLYHTKTEVAHIQDESVSVGFDWTPKRNQGSAFVASLIYSAAYARPVLVITSSILSPSVQHALACVKTSFFF